MNSNTLEIRLYGTRIGGLRRTERNDFTFQYDASYVSTPGAPSLGTRLPIRETPSRRGSPNAGSRVC